MLIKDASTAPSSPCTSFPGAYPESPPGPNTDVQSTRAEADDSTPPTDDDQGTNKDASTDYGSLPDLSPPRADPDDEEKADTVHSLMDIVGDYLSHAFSNLSLDQVQRDLALRELRLKQDDPEMIATATWGAYRLLCATQSNPVNPELEKDFRSTVLQLLPFFQAYAAKVRDVGFNTSVQVLKKGDHIDPTAGFLVFETDDYMQRQELIEEKHKSIAINRIDGYHHNETFSQARALQAQHASTYLRLIIGAVTEPLPPFPSNLLNDAFAIAKYWFQALPGTWFGEHPPHMVIIARIALEVCIACAGLHTESQSECDKEHRNQRKDIATSYHMRSYGQSGKGYFVPSGIMVPPIEPQYWKLVYPGSLALFGKMHPAIIDARTRYKACLTCGIQHVFGSVCPYNVSLLAETFLQKFHRFELIHCTPRLPITCHLLRE
ncbi:hypothetical protein M408DRAFT_301233 [Serendipita vermifera MAFF 305830]|uniref:Uncharacterized protein n=1 Tax=Serendipita vermifera MAFF 305830 TaxID=933852 RepID=A0A0C3AAR5_SERVB|nr:hypothetical protein M408DRAFT_301233 [Serendipita vermifera MAFF 305830]